MSGGSGDFSTNLFGSGGNFVTNTLGGTALANATGQAADAQLAQQQQDRSQAMSLMTPSAQQMQQLQQAMATNSQVINQSQQLLAAADPALIAAANNAQQLLQGGSSPLLAPIQNQRAQQRAQLTQQLQQQLGPGYATSSAGIQALQNFDQSTSNLMTQAQQATLGQLMGSVGQGAQLGTGQQQQGIGNSMGFANTNLNAPMVSAMMGNPVNPGLQYAGQMSQANATAQNMGGIFGIGYGNLVNGGSSQNGGLMSMFGGSGEQNPNASQNGSGLPSTSNNWTDVEYGSGSSLGGASAGAGEKAMGVMEMV